MTPETYYLKEGVLKFYTQSVKYGTYSQKDVLKRLSGAGIHFVLKKQYLTPEQNLKCVVSTQISGWWKFRKRWLLVLDCDSHENKEKATEELRLLSIKYKVFMSSPNHYWVVTNYIGSFKNCLNFMQSIPGVDREFIGFCSKYKGICLRAFPKDGYRPNLSSNWDSFHGKASLWAEAFLKYWGGSPIVNWLISRQREVISNAKKEAEKLLELKRIEEEELRKKKEEELKNKPKRSLRLEQI